MSYRLPFRTVLADGAITNANVNGSVTPRTFSYAPQSNQVVRIDYVSGLFAAAGNIQSFTDFITLPGLTNGITLDLQSLGNQDLRVGVLKNNINLLQFLTSSFEEKAIGVSSLYTGTIEINDGIILRGFNNDYYSFIVNDNLTGLTLANLIIAGSIYIE